MVQLRPAQIDVLGYRGGRLAVSAVPGSGKTFTLTRLAVELVTGKRLDRAAGQQVLIVTYLNTSVDHFRQGIRNRLAELGLDVASYEDGFDVRTLHSLGLEILRQAGIGGSNGTQIDVLEEVRGAFYLNQAVEGWIESNREAWYRFLPESSPQTQARWRQVTGQMAQSFIRTAKNERYLPAEILSRLGMGLAPGGDSLPWVEMLAGIYERYQTILLRQEVYDFNDLIWRAVDEVERRPDLAALLRQRWPYVLEDEAQDSVPLQEQLLVALTGPQGNLVRVGDPNQAITTTFTAADPRYFNRFIDRDDVVALPLPNSGRCAPIIMGAANQVVHWVCDSHPVPEVRRFTFRRQDILPTPPGDSQPNPAHVGQGITIKLYRHQEEEELPGVARLAATYLRKYAPEGHTVAILVPTHRLGHMVANHLDSLQVDYDNLLRGGPRLREVASALHAMLALLADPLYYKSLVGAYQALRQIGHEAVGAAREEDDPAERRFEALLRSVRRPEALFFPQDGAGLEEAMPAEIASSDDLDRLQRLASFLRRLFALRLLPIGDLTLTLSDALFRPAAATEPIAHLQAERDLDVAYQIAAELARWQDGQPEWRLPELVAELEHVARGRQSLALGRSPRDEGYEPQPGRITLATQHGAKGLEWDAVFLVGIDGRWIPGDLDGFFLGVQDFLGDEDPSAEVVAQLRYLMSTDGSQEGEAARAFHAGIYPGRTATESAHIDVISERLRLLYVGITRARRFLHISRSRATTYRGAEQKSEPATVMAEIVRYLKAYRRREKP